ncbi:unnamed protein product [Trichobilharzia szidati]|nr:unnamed protein product [Trichobilharzia szidati]
MVKGKFQTYFPFEKDSMTYSCLHCRAHLARHDDLISKSFQGSQGRAYLFNQAVNVRCAEAKQRVLLTGLHFVADIFCACCDTALGWKYERAFEPSQRYKEGKVIIELVHLYKDNSWDAEWLYPLYPATTTTTTSTAVYTNNSNKTKVTSVNCKKSHSVTISDYHNYESGKFQSSSLRSSQIPVCKSLSSTADGGIFESSTTDLIDVNDDSYTNFAHHQQQHQHQHHHHSHSHSHHPTSHNHHHHHHKHHYHSNSSSISSSTSTSTSSSSSVHTQQSSYTSLMPNDSLSYRLSSSLNATGWAFRIPPTATSSSNKGSHSYCNNSGSSNRNTCLLDLSDSGRVSDYHRNSASTSITDNNNNNNNSMGHLNPVCSIDNNNNDSNNDNNNDDSGVENNDNVTSESVYTTATDNSCNPNNNSNNNGNQIIIMNDNNSNKNHTDHEKFTKSKSLTPINMKLFPEGQSSIVTSTNTTTASTTNNNNNNSNGITSGHNRLEAKSSEMSTVDMHAGNRNNRIPMDDICLRKLSQFSTPQARRISKINPSNLRVTITSSLGKRGRKRSRHRRRASSASPSRDFLLPTGSEDEETDDIPELSDFNHQSHNVVQVQQ